MTDLNPTNPGTRHQARLDFGAFDAPIQTAVDAYIEMERDAKRWRALSRMTSPQVTNLPQKLNTNEGYAVRYAMDIARAEEGL